jgi:hypothetical protein
MELLQAQPRRIGLQDFVLGAVGRIGYSTPKRELDARINAARAARGLAPMTPWVIHDLQRSVATHMAEKLYIDPHMHKRGVAGVYNKATYERRKREALDRWGTYVEAALGRDGGHRTRLTPPAPSPSSSPPTRPANTMPLTVARSRLFGSMASTPQLTDAGVVPDIAIRLAAEGVPLCAIARATRIPSAELREQLRAAQEEGRLAPFGIGIVTEHGYGYRLNSDDRSRLMG